MTMSRVARRKPLDLSSWTLLGTLTVEHGNLPRRDFKVYAYTPGDPAINHRIPWVLVKSNGKVDVRGSAATVEEVMKAAEDSGGVTSPGYGADLVVTAYPLTSGVQ